jgi:hypothetical protein
MPHCIHGSMCDATAGTHRAPRDTHRRCNHRWVAAGGCDLAPCLDQTCMCNLDHMQPLSCRVPSPLKWREAMTDILRRIGTSKRSITRLAPVAFASMLAIVLAADTASAETLEHLRTGLAKPKVAAGSIPGHPNQRISTVPKKPPALPPVLTFHEEPNPDQPGYVARVPRGTVHQYHGPSCHDDVCESE